MKRTWKVILAIGVAMIVLGPTGCEYFPWFGNTPPTAEISVEPNDVLAGTLVTLDGSASRDIEDGSLLAYRWSMIGSGRDSELDSQDIDDAQSAVAYFIPDVDGTFIIRLTVTDSFGDSHSSSINIEVAENPNHELSLTDLTVSTGDLVPPFSPGITEYSVAVGDQISSISIEAEPAYATSTVGGTGAHDLDTQLTEIEITVESDDSRSRTYLVRVTRGVAEHILSYDGNGADPGITPADGRYEEGHPVSVAEPGSLTKTGFTFAGWNTHFDGTGVSFLPGAILTIGSSDITLYAQWAPIAEYRVYYDGNGFDGGSPPVDPIGHFEAETVTVHGIGTMSRTGYTFDTWNDQRSGDGQNYLPDSIFTMPASDITLYAQWVATPTYSVTYHGNEADGGTAPEDPNAYSNGDFAVVASPGTLSRTGYSFYRWNTDPSDQGAPYVPGTGIAIVGDDVVLYAIWTEDPTFRVFYDGAGADGGMVPTDPVSYLSGETAFAADPGTMSRSDHAFLGWGTSAGATPAYLPGEEITIVDTDITLYAQWIARAELNPRFELEPATYTTDVSVEIDCSTGAAVYYTLDGTDPDASDYLYAAPIVVAGDYTDITIRAIALHDDLPDSEVVEARYTIEYPPAPELRLSPAPGAFSHDVDLMITSGTGVDIYYTLDGTEPNATSTPFTGQIPIHGHGTTIEVRAIGIKDGFRSSRADGTYEIAYEQAATPRFTTPPGNYGESTAFQLECDTSGTTIYYTTNGEDPTRSSTEYNDAYVFSVTGYGSSLLVKAIAVSDTLLDSEIAVGAYNIVYNPLPTPVITPSGGNVEENTTVRISCDVPEAVIAYSTDGSEPTGAHAWYTETEPIVLTESGTQTIRAVAFVYQSEYSDSDIATAVFQVGVPVPSPVFNPAAGTYQSDLTVDITCSDPEATIHYTLDGSDPTDASQLYDSGTLTLSTLGTHTVKAIAVREGFASSEIIESIYTIEPPQASHVIDFENQSLDAVSFTGDGVTLNSDPTFVHQGSYSLRISEKNSDGSTAGTRIIQPVSPMSEIELSFYVYLQSLSYAYASINFWFETADARYPYWPGLWATTSGYNHFPDGSYPQFSHSMPTGTWTKMTLRVADGTVSFHQNDTVVYQYSYTAIDPSEIAHFAINTAAVAGGTHNIVCYLDDITCSWDGAAISYTIGEEFSNQTIEDGWTVALNGGTYSLENGAFRTQIPKPTGSSVSACNLTWNDSIDLSQDFTLEARLKQTGYGGSRIYLKRSDDSSQYLRYGIDTDDWPYLAYRKNDTETTVESSAPYLGAFHRYEIEKQGSVYSFYVDNVFKGSISHPELHDTTGALHFQLYTAGWKSGANEVFIDYVRLK